MKNTIILILFLITFISAFLAGYYKSQKEILLLQFNNLSKKVIQVEDLYFEIMENLGL